MNNRGRQAIRILNVLMNDGGWLTTPQICKRTGCERKAVYFCTDILEANGFGIETDKRNGKNIYRYKGIYGLD